MTRLRDTPHGKLLPRDAAKLTGRPDGRQVTPLEYLIPSAFHSELADLCAGAAGVASRPCPSPRPVLST
jgi:hypothetical protein